MSGTVKALVDTPNTSARLLVRSAFGVLEPDSYFAVRKSALVGVHCLFVLQYSAQIEIIIPIEFSQHEPIGLSKNFFIHLHFSCSCGRVLLSPKTTRR